MHHVVPLPGDRRFGSGRIDTSELRHILWIDPEARTAACEPGVSFEELVRATLPLGLAPTVVPELRGITVGGAIAGCSIESMSFRHGGFHDSCLAYDVIGGDGALHHLSPTQRPELFHHLHGSYGTLGILTKVTFRLVPVSRYVEVTYRHLRSFDDFESELLAASEPDAPNDLVDGIIFSPEHLVLCLGRFIEDLPSGAAPSDYTGTEIYYRSAGRLTRDVMTAEQYFFRYDTECHWLTRTVPPLEWRWVRRLVGRRVLGSTNLIGWSDKLAPIIGRARRRPDVVCDVFLPARRFAEFFAWYRVTLDHWPLWVVPYRPPTVYPWIGAHVRAGVGDGELFIDVAVYGARNTARDIDLSASLEDEVFRLGGIKTLIGRNHYDADRFWTIYDRRAYEAAKAELDPTSTFPDLYAKLGRVD